jgi:hypothetical protein
VNPFVGIVQTVYAFREPIGNDLLFSCETQGCALQSDVCPLTAGVSCLRLWPVGQGLLVSCWCCLQVIERACAVTDCSGERWAEGLRRECQKATLSDTLVTSPCVDDVGADWDSSDDFDLGIDLGIAGDTNTSEASQDAMLCDESSGDVAVNANAAATPDYPANAHVVCAASEQTPGQLRPAGDVQGIHLGSGTSSRLLEQPHAATVTHKGSQNLLEVDQGSIGHVGEISSMPSHTGNAQAVRSSILPSPAGCFGDTRPQQNGGESQETIQQQSSADAHQTDNPQNMQKDSGQGQHSHPSPLVRQPSPCVRREHNRDARHCSGIGGGYSATSGQKRQREYGSFPQQHAQAISDKNFVKNDNGSKRCLPGLRSGGGDKLASTEEKEVEQQRIVRDILCWGETSQNEIIDLTDS